MLEGSGTLDPVPPPLEPVPPPVEPVLPPPDEPQPELPQPELPQPELPQPELPQVACAGAPTAKAIAATPVKTAHFIGFKIYLHPKFKKTMDSKATSLPIRRISLF